MSGITVIHAPAGILLHVSLHSVAGMKTLLCVYTLSLCIVSTSWYAWF